MQPSPISVDVILGQITESIIVIDTQLEIVYLNKITESYSAYSPRKIELGCQIYDVIDPVNLEIFDFSITQAFEKGQSNTIEIAVYKDDGIPAHFEVTFNPIFNQEESSPAFVCLVSRDITAQKTFEKKTLQLVKELSDLIETANAVIFGVDSQGYVTEWNRECTRITGYEKDEILGRKADLILSRMQATEFSHLSAKIFAGIAINNFEFEMGKKNSRPVRILLNGTPRKSGSGQVIGALFVGQDVTELMDYRLSLEDKVRDRTIKLREALQKEKDLVELKNKFVAIASHEFKVPLSAISTTVEVLRSGSDSHQQENLTKIVDHVHRMKSLLEDVLNIERHESIKLKPKISAVNLNLFLEKLIKEVGDATSHSHQFVKSFPSEQLIIQSDEKLLRNIFINLLNNAVKFSPGSSEVLVSATRYGNGIQVSIQDFGIGIDEAELENVFDAFTRGSNTGEIKGTGLGLSIVKKAVESISASISVQSVKNCGTTFSVRFPPESD